MLILDPAGVVDVLVKSRSLCAIILLWRGQGSACGHLRHDYIYTVVLDYTVEVWKAAAWRGHNRPQDNDAGVKGYCRHPRLDLRYTMRLHYGRPVPISRTGSKT